jgi:uncharacterized protein YuzE
MGYLYLRRSGERGGVATTRMLWDENLRTELAMDFDSDGHLIGIELFSMSRVLRSEIFDLDLAMLCDREGDRQVPAASACPLIGMVVL